MRQSDFYSSPALLAPACDSPCVPLRFSVVEKQGIQQLIIGLDSGCFRLARSSAKICKRFRIGQEQH